MIGIILAIVSAATAALSVVFTRKYSDQSNTFNISLAISIVGLLVLWPLAVFFTDFSTVNILALLMFALCGFLTPGLVRLLYYQGMNKLGASVNAAFFSIYPLYTSILAVFLISEVIAPLNWMGVLLIFVGGFLVEFTAQGSSNGGKISKFNLIFPLLGGLALGVGNIFRKSALDFFNAPLLGVVIAYTVTVLFYLIIVVFSKPVRQKLSFKKDLRLFWLAGIGQAVAWVSSYYALSFDYVSVIVPLLSIEPIFVALFAYLYLQKIEKVSAKLVASIALTLIGVVLVTAKFGF